MSTPIYQLFIGVNNVTSNMALRALPEDERKSLMEKDEASRKAVGAKVVVICNSAWADEQHPWWGVLRFPSLEARIEHTKTLQKIGWLDAVEAFTLLGTSDAEPEEVNIPNPIYKLWVVKTNPAAAQYQLTKGLEAAMWEKHNAVYEEVGGKNILLCNSYWCNEAYPFFGISVYPSIEANMKVMQTLDELGWRSFLDVSITLLGIPQ